MLFWVENDIFLWICLFRQQVQKRFFFPITISRGTTVGKPWVRGWASAHASEQGLNLWSQRWSCWTWYGIAEYCCCNSLCPHFGGSTSCKVGVVCRQGHRGRWSNQGANTPTKIFALRFGPRGLLCRLRRVLRHTFYAFPYKQRIVRMIRVFFHMLLLWKLLMRFVWIWCWGLIQLADSRPGAVRTVTRPNISIHSTWMSGCARLK
jgi:hypothetical protein